MDDTDATIADSENLLPKRVHGESDAEATPSKRRRVSSKQQKDQVEAEKKRQEREEIQRCREEQKEKKRKEQEEKKRQKEVEAEKKRVEREEAQRLRDEKKRQKEAEAEKKRQEFEETQRLRDEKRRQKEEEKLQKQHEKELKEQEKQQKEEKKKANLERQSTALLSFLYKKEVEEPKTWGWSSELFRPFQIKERMTVAPVFKRDPLTKEAYNNLLSTTITEKSEYLSVIVSKKCRHVRKDPLRAKYFHFYDNYRPPYYGTWRKVSTIINGRRPFVKSDKELNYDIDSDGEWEEEQAEAGEDCLSEVDDGYKDESNDSCDDFYVDHGYLSDNEGSENEDSNNEENPDQRKRRMDQRAREFTKQRTNKTRRVKKNLTVQIYGLNWQPMKPSLSEINQRLMEGVVFDFSSVKD